MSQSEIQQAILIGSGVKARAETNSRDRPSQAQISSATAQSKLASKIYRAKRNVANQGKTAESS